MPVLEVSKRITDALVGLLKGTGDVVSNTVGVTRDITSRTLYNLSGRGKETSRVVNQAVIAAIKAAHETGAEVGSVTKGAVIGAIQGVDEVTKVTPGVISDVARAAVRGTREVGGDMTLSARKAVEGAIEAGKQAGLKAEDAASAGAAGAVAAAAEVSEAVAGIVAKALSGTISGIRVVLESPLKKPTILILDANRHDLDLLSQQLTREGFNVNTASDVKGLNETLQAAEEKASLALVDVSGFDSEIWEGCDRLQNSGIPFLVLSPGRSHQVLRDSMKHGAGGVLIKPVSVKVLVDHIRSLLGD